MLARIGKRIGTALALVMALCTAAAAQQKYPSRNIDLIIPFAVGGGVDLIGRAMRRVARRAARADGGRGQPRGRGRHARLQPSSRAPRPTATRLAFSPSTPIANAPYLVKGVRYTADSFEYICQVFENVFTFSVGPNSKFKTAQELFDAGEGASPRASPSARRSRIDPASVRSRISPMR